MADLYASEFIGQADGTAYPPKKLDSRVVGAKKRRVRATKPTGVAIAAGDRMYLGKLPNGASVRGFSICSNTSLGTTTVSIGTTAAPTKYVNAKTMTVTDVPTAIGPQASAFIAAPLAADEEIWATFAVAGIAGAVVMAIDTEYTIST
ncbi:MAG: hypothetical protein QHC65_04215 [Sphingomonas sp.]|nr:hypothetical protein [Sphingomonas sp.]MDX3883603.1 hypothetical protein [Sphingomonas sp.]